MLAGHLDSSTRLVVNAALPRALADCRGAPPRQRVANERLGATPTRDRDDPLVAVPLVSVPLVSLMQTLMRAVSNASVPHQPCKATRDNQPTTLNLRQCDAAP